MGGNGGGENIFLERGERERERNVFVVFENAELGGICGMAYFELGGAKVTPLLFTPRSVG